MKISSQERLFFEYIERQLFKNSTITRSQLSKHFRLGGEQSTRVFNLYRKLHPENLDMVIGNSYIRTHEYKRYYT